MDGKLIRTAIVTSLITALAVSTFAFYLGPKLMNRDANNPALQPAGYNGAAQSDAYVQPEPRARLRRSSYRQSVRDASGEPVVRHHRRTRDSVLIVAGSAGTGAAIGALAGGGKGAGIGALAGGAAGLIYDRMTANK